MFSGQGEYCKECGGTTKKCQHTAAKKNDFKVKPAYQHTVPEEITVRVERGFDILVPERDYRYVRPAGYSLDYMDDTRPTITGTRTQFVTLRDRINQAIEALDSVS